MRTARGGILYFRLPTFSGQTSDIRDTDQLKALAEAIREQHPDVVLIVIDTLSQHVPGGSEDTADMSAALHGCQYLRDQLDTTVLALHHPTKANEDNERGGGGFRNGCADVLNVTEKDGVFILQSQNARDRSKDIKVPYVLDVVTLQGAQFRDEDGQQWTSCVPKLAGAYDLEAAVLGALTDAPQSALALSERLKRRKSDVTAVLKRLQKQRQADRPTVAGWEAVP